MKDEHPIPAEVTSPRTSSYPQKKKSRIKTSFMTFVMVLLLAGAGYGGYYLSNVVSGRNGVDGTTNSKNQSNTTQKSITNSSTFHTVVSVGYPFNTTKTITTKLAVPNRLQAVAIQSDIQNPGYTESLANKFNDEMGRWQFGNPVLTGVDTTAGDVSIIHISSDWLQETTKNQDSNGGNSVNGYDFSTPAKKASSLTKLAADTNECSKDNAKGSVFSGGLNVCYTPSLVRQSTGSYHPTLDLKGYGQVDGQAYVLFGYLNLITKDYSETIANKMGDDFVRGAIPDETKQLIAEYTNALKNSSIVSAQR